MVIGSAHLCAYQVAGVGFAFHRRLSDNVKYETALLEDASYALINKYRPADLPLNIKLACLNVLTNTWGASYCSWKCFIFLNIL